MFTCSDDRRVEIICSYCHEQVLLFCLKVAFQIIEIGNSSIIEASYASNNLDEICKPTVTKCTKKPYTKVEFLPDYERFDIIHLTREEISSLPGVHRWGCDSVLGFLQPLVEDGLSSVLLFGVIGGEEKVKFSSAM